MTDSEDSMIEKALDAKVRPVLTRDGGNLEVIDLRQNDQAHILSIRYLGACHGCASSATGTRTFIEDALRKEVDASITVQIM
jgi:NifU-like protein